MYPRGRCQSRQRNKCNANVCTKVQVATSSPQNKLESCLPETLRYTQISSIVLSQNKIRRLPPMYPIISCFPYQLSGSGKILQTINHNYASYNPELIRLFKFYEITNIYDLFPIKGICSDLSSKARPIQICDCSSIGFRRKSISLLDRW